MPAISRRAVALGIVAGWPAAACLAAAAAEHKPEAPPAAPAEKPRPRITISKETTYLTGPLRPDGYVDYVAALNAELSRGVTPENNAAVPLMLAFGPKAVSEKQREAFFKLLGVPVPPDGGNYFVAVYRYVNYLHGLDELPGIEKRPSTPIGSKEWDEADAECAQAQKRPWSREGFPVIAGWLEANHEPLRLIGEAARRPRFYAPLVPSGDPPMTSVLLSISDAFFNAARLLEVRAMLHLHDGKVDRAWQDLLACQRLARHVGQGPFLTDGLIAIAVEQTALRGDAALAHYGRPTAAKIRQMRADLGALPAAPKMADRIDHSERFFGLDLITTAARKGVSHLRDIMGTFSDEPQGLIEKIRSAGLDAAADWDEPLRISNRWYDRWAAAARKPARAERVATMADCKKDIKALAAGVQRVPGRLLEKMPRPAAAQWIGEAFAVFLTEALDGVTRAEDRLAAERTLADVALDLAVYRADHGKYPDRLADLKPKYRAEIKDPFLDADLIYRPAADGFLLYSVGPNGKDDGGRNRLDYLTDESPPPGYEQWDDVVLRMPVSPRKR